MNPNPKFSKLATPQQLQKTIKALSLNGFTVELVENGKEAKEKVLAIIPKGAEVFTMTSQTLEETGIAKEINESNKYDALRPKLYAMDRNTQGREMRKLGASPDWVVTSAHAITEEGHLLIASATGSQLSPEAYAGEKVIFVVGTQKLVTDTSEGIKRIYEYAYPLEDERAQQAYGAGSGVNKILIINKEIRPNRIYIILVKEKLGF